MFNREVLTLSIGYLTKEAYAPLPNRSSYSLQVQSAYIYILKPQLKNIISIISNGEYLIYENPFLSIFSKKYNSNYAMYSVHCTVVMVQCTPYMYRSKGTMYTVHVHCTLYSSKGTMYTVHVQ